jgi:hypothetical protein
VYELPYLKLLIMQSLHGNATKSKGKMKVRLGSENFMAVKI